MTSAVAAWAATTTPSPAPVDPESVSPGLWGFAVVFVLAVVVWLLMRNLTGHLRRLRFREEERLRREAAEGGSEAGRRDTEEDGPSAPGARR